MPGSSPVSHLLETIEATLHAKRREAWGPVDAVRQALDVYALAVEHALTSQFAQAHSLRQPSAPAVDAATSAQRLLAAVQALPELVREPSPPPKVEGAHPAPVVSTPASKPSDASPPITSQGLALGALLAAAARAPIVVVGGGKLGGLRALPAPLPSLVEWVETSRQGTHAIGNLERRIRDGRLSALVLVEGALGHKHTDPLLGAARRVGLPFAFAGRGGQRALERAFHELELSLRKRDG